METERDPAHPENPKTRDSSAETDKRLFTFFMAVSLRLRDAAAELNSNAPATSGVNRLKTAGFEKLKTLAIKNFHSWQLQ